MEHIKVIFSPLMVSTYDTTITTVKMEGMKQKQEVQDVTSVATMTFTYVEIRDKKY